MYAEIEIGTMIDLINQKIVPCAIENGIETVAKLHEAMVNLHKSLTQLDDRSDLKQTAMLAQQARLGVLEKTRTLCDEVEALCAADIWPLCPYRKLIFLDQCYDHHFKKPTAQ